MTNEIAKLRPNEVQPATPSNAMTTPTAVESIMAGLQSAISEMKADDISVDLSASQEGHKSHASFRIRAYRRGQKVVDESSDKGE